MYSALVENVSSLVISPTHLASSRDPHFDGRPRLALVVPEFFPWTALDGRGAPVNLCEPRSHNPVPTSAGPRDQRTIAPRGLTLEKCRLEDSGRADPVWRSTATRRFTAGPRWRTARIPAARSGWRLSCAIARRCWEPRSTRVAIADPLHRTRVVSAGRGHEPRPVPGPLTERSDLMTQKICFDCFHKLFPDKPIRKVTLGRQCVVCKAQTDRTEQMIPVEAEDIPLVKQIAQVPRRVLHRTERHADPGVAVRVAARGAGQMG
jgi:hypothetical protein